MAPSVVSAGYIFTGTRTSDRRRLPDQTGMGAMTRNQLPGSNLDFPSEPASEQSRIREIFQTIAHLSPRHHHGGRLPVGARPAQHADQTNNPRGEERLTPGAGLPKAKCRIEVVQSTLI
jgi:hypothetical protein